MKSRKRRPIPFDKARDPSHVTKNLPMAPCQRLMDSLGALKETQKAVLYHLPEHLRTHCRVGSFNEGVLTLVTSNATWATHLRGESADLRFALRRNRVYAGLSQIVVRVKPEQMKASTPKRSLPAVRPPSNSAKSIIAMTAESVIHPDLKAALRRLAGR